MNQTQVQPQNNDQGFFDKYRLVLKAVIIFVLIVLLLIPQFMIINLIDERVYRQQEVFTEISSKWSGKQTLSGPVIVVPYYEYFQDSNKIVRKEKRFMHFLPEDLKVNGTLFPEKRHRSIYDIVVYNSDLHIEGEFSPLRWQDLNIPAENIIWNEISLVVGLDDLRGIDEMVNLKWDGKTMSFNPGIPNEDVFVSGINTRFRLDSLKEHFSAPHQFTVDLKLKGSEKLFFTPVGKQTIINLQSNWPTPKFDGAFLPDTNSVSEKGFSAEWKVLHLNRNFPQQWIGNQYNVVNSEFGVNLLTPVDGYQKTMRSAKYAMMIVLLTFIVFFFIEVLNKSRIHPFHYLLVGFALCLFYTLLLSFSEYMNFNLSYGLALLLTLGSIVYYTYHLFKPSRLHWILGGTLLLIYGFMFTIIQLEDYALLIGSLGLFAVLVTIMNYSKNIDWYNMDKRKS